MNNLEVRQQVKSYIDQLSADKLLVAADFLAYLVEKEDHEATQELLDIPGFENELREAEEQVTAGDFVSFNSIRRDV